MPLIELASDRLHHMQYEHDRELPKDRKHSDLHDYHHLANHPEAIHYQNCLGNRNFQTARLTDNIVKYSLL